MTALLPRVVALLAIVAVGGCGSAPAPDPRPSPGHALDGFRAEVRQYRPDEAQRKLSLYVHNAAGPAVLVEQVQLDAPAFAPVAPSPAGEALLRPGQGIDFRADYGPARCGAAPADPPSVIAQVRVPDAASPAPPATLRLPVEGSAALLTRLRERECGQQQLAGAVSARLLPDLEETSRAGWPSLRARLELRRLADELVRVTGVTGSVSYELTPERPGPQVTLDAATPSAVVPVLVRAGRCDGHGLGGSTKPFDFSVQVSVGSAPPASLLFTADEETRRRLVESLSFLCEGRLEDR